MQEVARPISVSLAPFHEQHIERIEQRIREKARKSTNRSEAIQIALIYFDNNAPVAELVKKNQKIDRRRKRK